MFQKTKRSIALIMALMMSVSLFSGIVLAQGSVEAPLSTPIEETTVETEQYVGTESATDPYAAAKGTLTGDVYAPATGVIFIHNGYAVPQEALGGTTPFTYTYGGDGWGDGAQYSVTYGVNFFTDYDSAYAKINASKFGGVTLILYAPGKYSINIPFNKISDSSLKILGPQAGKTPVNNPKKGYTGNDPWSVANGRGVADDTKEAIITSFTANMQTRSMLTFDGFAFSDIQFTHNKSGNSFWTGWEFKNIYWTTPNDKPFIKLLDNNSGQNYAYRVVYMTDCYVDAMDDTMQYYCELSYQKFIVDGCYWKFNKNASPQLRTSDNVQAYSLLQAYVSFYTTNDNADRYGDGIDELKFTNSRFEGITMRGLMCDLSSANRGYPSRPQDSVRYIYTNNEFIDASNPAGGVAALRSKYNGVSGADSVVFTDNYVYYSTPKTASNTAFIDVHKNTGTIDTVGTIENNVFINVAKPAGYASAGSSVTAWNLNYNYFGNSDGTLIKPTAFNCKAITGAYVDQGCKLHSSEVAVTVAKDLTNELVINWADYTIEATLPLNDNMTAESFAASQGITLALYSDKTCETPLSSLAGSAKVTTSYLKASKNGGSVVYTVTTVPDVEPYVGEKVFFDPEVEGVAEGTNVIRVVNGEAYLLTVGQNIVATITDEAYPEIEGATHIWFLPGKYANFKTASGSYYYHGAKAGINANDPNDITKPNPARVSDEEETILYNGDYSVTSADGKVTFDGFTFTGNAKVSIGASVAANASKTIQVDFINNRNSLAENAYSSAPGTAFIHGFGYELKKVNVTDNRFIGQCYSGESATAFSVIRSWIGTASGNYIDCADSVAIANQGNEKEIFWVYGEISNGVATQSQYDATITGNYLVGRVSTNVNPHRYSDYKIAITDNTMVAGEESKSIINVYPSSSYFGSAKIDISGNTVRNTLGLKGIGFIWLTGTTNDAGMANFDSKNLTITDNDIDLGTTYSYVFGADSRKDDRLIVDASSNTIANVLQASGTGQGLFNNENGAYHFDLGTGADASKVNGTAVDKAPEGASYDLPAANIDTENKIITVAVTDDVTNYLLSATNGATVAILDENGEAVALDGKLRLTAGINNFKVAISSVVGVYLEETVYDVTVIKQFVTVDLDEDETVASQMENASKWQTYWEANINMIANASSVIAGNEFKVVDYGMYYANDADDLQALIDDAAYETTKARKVSYAADEAGLNKVYKNYSFRFTGINEFRYRYGVFYVTYEINGTTVTTLSSMKELYTGSMA